MAKTYTVGIAGTTSHTRVCAEALRRSGLFEVLWVLTPPPQPIGRKQILTKNPMQLWAEELALPVISVEGKLKPELQESLTPQPDFLLVVDFGYLVPKWLLEWPLIAPLNVHPSLLPEWRGSSPGQFVLLYGEKNSAVTIMIMGEGLDTGPILWQREFSVLPSWTQPEYYDHSFGLAAAKLPDVMIGLAQGSVIPQPQPETSPTPTAKRFKKDDGFVDWETLAQASGIALSSTVGLEEHHTSSFLLQVQQDTQHEWPELLNDAVRGLFPWPGIWTFLPTTKGLKRMKVLSAHLENGQLSLDQVQVEGLQASTWNETKSLYVA